MVQFNFNREQFEPATGVAALPAGIYPVIITKQEVQPTQKNPNNKMLVLTMQVTDGPHRGSTIFDRLNLWHENSQTSEIACRTLSAICYVGNIPGFTDTAQLVNLRFLVKLNETIIKGENGQNDRKGNEIGAYLDAQGNPPKSGSAPAAPQQPAGAPPAPNFGQPPAPGFGQGQPPAAPQGFGPGAPPAPPAPMPQPQQWQAPQGFGPAGAPPAAPGFGQPPAAPQGFGAPQPQAMPPAWGPQG